MYKLTHFSRWALSFSGQSSLAVVSFCFYYVWERFHAMEIQEALLQTQRNTCNMCIRLYYTAVSTEVRPLFVEPLPWVVFVVCVLCILLGAVNIQLFRCKSQGCSGNVIKRLWIAISEKGSSIPGLDRQSYLLRRVQTGSGTYPASYSIGTGDLTLE